jgi:hypothetical protein
MSEYDPVDLNSKDEAKKKRDIREKLEQATEDGDIRWLMGSRRGRRIVWRLLERAGVFRLTFNTNAMTMAFAEGNRNFGNHMLMQIHALCPELYPVMLKEATDGRSSNDDSRDHQYQ